MQTRGPPVLLFLLTVEQKFEGGTCRISTCTGSCLAASLLMMCCSDASDTVVPGTKTLRRPGWWQPLGPLPGRDQQGFVFNYLRLEQCRFLKSLQLLFYL